MVCLSTRWSGWVCIGVAVLACLCGCSTTAELDRGDLLMGQRKYDEAIAVWEGMLRESPRNTKLLTRVATAQTRKGCLEEAEATMLRAAAIEPGSPKVHHNLALVYLKQKRLDLALATFEHVLALQSTYPEANYYIGLIHEMRGDVDAAVRHYVLDVNNGPSRAWQRLDHHKARQRQLGLEPQEPAASGVHVVTGVLIALAAAAYGARVVLERRRQQAPAQPWS